AGGSGTGGLGTGAMGTTGTSFSGALGGTGRGTTAGANLPAASNTFQSFYGNPMATAFSSGISGTGMTATTKKFGQPMYSVTTGATASTSALSNTLGAAEGFTTMGMRRAPSFNTVLGAEMPRVVHAPVQVRTELARSLQLSPLFKERNVDVSVEGGVIVLRGEVASDR